MNIRREIIKADLAGGRRKLWMDLEGEDADAFKE